MNRQVCGGGARHREVRVPSASGCSHLSHLFGVPAATRTVLMVRPIRRGCQTVHGVAGPAGTLPSTEVR